MIVPLMQTHIGIGIAVIIKSHVRALSFLNSVSSHYCLFIIFTGALSS